MKKRGLLKVLGISLFLFTILFSIADKSSLGSMTQATITFLNINKSIPDANYLQWGIESLYDFSVSVWIEDIHGNNITISFGPNNENNSWDYEVDEEVDYLMVAFPVNNRIYESESFEDLLTLFLSEDDDSTFELTDETIIKRIQIDGIDFKLYSITLAHNDNFDNPCWEKDASDWNNLYDFRSDGGDVGLSTDIQFYNSYIHIIRVVGNSPFYPYYSPPGYMGNIGWNQPYFGWNQPYYGYRQLYSPYGYQLSNNLNVGPWIWEGEPPAGWQPPPPPPYGYYQPPTLANDVGGYIFGYQQFFNPYGYQQPYYPYGWNPYRYQQSYNSYGYGYSPEDRAIMAAGGLPSWFEMPDWEERRPYLYGLNNPYGSPPPLYGYGYPIPQD